MDELVTCPYCGEEIELSVDEDGGASQQYVEDCAVCCRPMGVRVSFDEEGEPTLQVHRSDE
jgi:hypothetical protein